MICRGYYYVSGWVSVRADSGCFFLCSARVKSHIQIWSLSCLQCCGENKTTLLSAQLHHSPSAAWGAVVTQRGVTLKSKEQTQLINMRGQDWPDCLWSQICGEESWAARVCVCRNQRVCVILTQKKWDSQPGAPEMTQWVHRRLAQWGVRKQVWLGLLSGSMRAICMWLHSLLRGRGALSTLLWTHRGDAL